MHLLRKSARTAFERGWSRIWGTCQGGIFLVPTETHKIVVKLQPSLGVSCFFQPKIRPLRASCDKHNEVDFFKKTPSLLLHQVLFSQLNCGPFSACKICDFHSLLCYCQDCLLVRKSDTRSLRARRHRAIKSARYMLYEVIDPDKDCFQIRPYRIANVGERGSICFGGQTIPPSSRQANFNFWNSTFNNDYTEIHKPHRSSHCTNKHHGVRPFRNCSGTFRNHSLRCRKKVVHNCNCLQNDSYHKGDCLCFYRCQCPCECLCCKNINICQCPCTCSCCLKQCNCPCDCDRNILFAKQLEAYVAETETCDGFPFIFGSSYLASTKKTDGIFITIA